MAADIWSWFWNVVVIFATAFIFITALTAVITVIFDLFRDHTIKGWQKAIWILFLIVLPFLSTLIYLIVRGPGISKRAAERQKEVENATESYIRDVAQVSPVDQIARAKSLLDSGAISADEFAQLKQRALANA